MADAPRVFISYSHDSAEHADRVLALADALCAGGINVILDRYVHSSPAEGWPLWMERNLKAADSVLLVCTETYCRRVRAEEMPGQGTGVRWEGRIVYNELCYGANPGGTRFIPILLPGAEPIHIPDPVRGYNHYRLATINLTDPSFEALYRHLTDQPATPRPDLGEVVILPPKPRPQAILGPLPPSGPLPSSGGLQLYSRPENWYCIFCGWHCTEPFNDYICKSCGSLRPFAGGSATMVFCNKCMQFSLGVAQFCEWCGSSFSGPAPSG